MKISLLSGVLVSAASLAYAQNATLRAPIIDMHVHAAMSMGGQPAC